MAIMTTDPVNQAELARAMHSVFQDARMRGHTQYCLQAKRMEELFNGGGRQWTREDREAVRSQGRPIYEFNMVKPAINSMGSYQIKNRVDPSCLPVGGEATIELAEVLSKVLKDISTKNRYAWSESQLFMDGIIQQRGYMKIDMDYSRNVMGEVRLRAVDPLNVIPDPDASDYDPDNWRRVQVLAWYTLDEIEERFGADKRAEVELSGYTDPDWGNDDGTIRNKFGLEGMHYSYDTPSADKLGIRRIRVIETEEWKYEKAKVAIFDAADIRVIDSLPQEKVDEWVKSGAILSTRPAKRIRITCTTSDVVLWDAFSPFGHISIVPFFCSFRRGITSGMIDDAAGPQEGINKLLSQALHIINTTANSGWKVQQGSLVSHDRQSLQEQGAATGLVIEYKVGSVAPEKIEPNVMPSGVVELAALFEKMLKDCTLPDAARGLVDGIEASGAAINAKQFANQHQLAVCLDNFARTRNLIWRNVLDLVQRFYTDGRWLRIIEQDDDDEEAETMVPLNQFDDDGNLVNDLSRGNYDIVITEVAQHATTDTASFDQLTQLKDLGVPIPDSFLVKASSYSEKSELNRAMKAAGSNAPAAPVDPTLQAKADLMAKQGAVADAQAQVHAANAKLLAAKTNETHANSVESNVRSLYGAMEAANVAASNPATGPLADKMLGSAGFVDNDAAPIIPQAGQTAPISDAIASAGAPPPNAMASFQGGTQLNPPGFPASTNPMSPARPASPIVGVNKGIETMRQDG